MWKHRYDDLWLWPFPGWFVAFCNRLGGTRVLDIIFLLTLAGLIAAFFSGWIALGLLSPALLLLVLLIGNAMYLRFRKLSPEEKRRLQEEDEQSRREWAALTEQAEAVSRRETQFCKTCGGQLKIETRPVQNGEVVEIKCEKGCTRAFWGSRSRE